MAGALLTDRRVLKELGVAGVFTPGATTDAIVQFIRDGAARAGGRLSPAG